MRLLVCTALATLSLALLPRTAGADPVAAYEEARAALFELRGDARRRAYRHHWLDVAGRLDRSVRALGKHPRRCDAIFNAARAHQELSEISYLQEDRDEAIARYLKLVETCPSSNLADDSLWRAATLQRKRDAHAARRSVERLLERYPEGDMAVVARQLRAELPKAPPAAARAAVAGREAARRPAPDAAERKAEPARAPEPEGALPSVSEILARLDRKGADEARPEDVALEEDLAKDRAAKLDGERLARLEKVTGGEIPLSLAAGLKVRRVVIDAGHGGKDTGAIGKKGTREKDVTLAIARKLKQRLEGMGLEVFLTRDSDAFLELEERTRFANEKKADLFVSVHVNAARNPKARGVETYTLNLNSDRYAMRLAARENASSSKRIGDLQFILADLATKANTDDSVKLARLVQGEMISGLRQRFGTGIRDLGVKQALFFVLLGAKMPAILVETAFVSNPAEEKLVASGEFQERAARSIARGIERFISEREAIARGDTRSAKGSGVF